MAETEATYFEQLAVSMGLSQEAIDRAWASLRKAKVGANDAEAVRIILHEAMVDDLAKFKGVQAAAEKAILAASTKAAAAAKAAAEKEVQAAVAKIRATEAASAEAVGKAVAVVADKALARRVRVLDRASIASISLVSVLVAAGAVAVGWHLGAADMARQSGEWTALLQRGDGPLWAALARANDVGAAAATYCKGGGYHGCTLTMWLDRAQQAGHLGGPLGAVLAWFDSFPGWEVAAASLVLGLQVRRLGGLIKWPPVRLVLGLPLMERK